MLEFKKAKAWASSEREVVKKWVDEQRAMIQRERHRAANSAMLTQRERQQEERRQQTAATIEGCKKKKTEENDALRATIQKLKLDMDSAKVRSKSQMKKLKETINDHKKHIHSLEQELTSLKEEPMRKGVFKKKRMSGTAPPLKTKPSATILNNSGGKLMPNQSDHQQGNSKKGKPVRQLRSNPKIGNGKGSDSSAHVLDANTDHEKEMKYESTENQLEQDQQPGLKPGGSEIIENGSNTKVCYKVQNAFDSLMDEPTEDWLQRHLTGIKTSFPPAEKIKEGSSNSIVKKITKNDCNKIHPISQNNDAGIPDTIRFQNWKDYDANEYSGMVNCQAVEHTPIIARPAAVDPTISLTSGKGRKERVCLDGRKIVSYQNGTQKETQPDGTNIIRFLNGDIKTMNAKSGSIIYYYASAKVRKSKLVH